MMGQNIPFKEGEMLKIIPKLSLLPLLIRSSVTDSTVYAHWELIGDRISLHAPVY